jgi:hypothetical protein
MSSAFGFLPLLALLVYGVIIGIAIQVIIVLFLAIRALKIYIQKNS